MSEFSENQAKQRFLFLNALRISGVLFVFLGIAVVRQAIEWPVEVGYLFILLGLVDVFFLPLLMARRWTSGGE